MQDVIWAAIALAAFLAIIVIFNSVKVVREWERGVLLRLGRFDHVKRPGLRFVFPFIDQLMIIDTRVVTMDVPKQKIITRDNVSVQVDAVVFFQVIDAGFAVTKVENWVRATSLVSQTTLRSVVGQAELDELLAWARRGPRAARVDRVEVEEVAAEDVPAHFEQRPTA